MRRPRKTDGFREMIEKDQPGAKEKAVDVVAELVAEFDGGNQQEIAEEILRWLHEGDELEG